MALSSILLTELSYPNLHRTATFYLVSAAMYPAFLVAFVRVEGVRFGATVMTAVYALVSMTMIWLLPLFPAQPKLAPIFNPVAHMVPPPFPLLLVVPAFVLDLYGLCFRRWRSWWADGLLAAGAAVLFLAVFVPVQWWSRRIPSPRRGPGCRVGWKCCSPSLGRCWSWAGCASGR